MMLLEPTTFVPRLVEYARQTDPPATSDELVVPEDLSTLSDDELDALHQRAVTNFDALYGDGSGLSADDLATLGSLTEVLETLLAEVASRATAQTERDEAAAALATRVRPEGETETTDEAPSETTEEQPEGTVTDLPAQGEGAAPVPVAAAAQGGETMTAGGGRRGMRVNLSGVRSRQTRHVPAAGEGRTLRDVLVAADVPGYHVGEGLDWDRLGQLIDRRLQSYNHSMFAAAAAAGRPLRERHSLAMLRKPYPENTIIRNTDPNHVESVLRQATDESLLPGGSLVASGGWCAPSTTLYDLFEVESRDGLFSLPEVGVTRGGINHTPGPDFATLYSGNPGWNYTEEQDEAGTYAVDANGNGTGAAGTKPCAKVDCPPFADVRLEVNGLCISAGLLQSRGFPEMTARTSRGALVAHDHRMSGRLIARIESGSTAVAATSDQVGSVAPLLDAIELQVEHYRYVHRLARNRTLEAVFPFWVRGALRSDLSRRLGVDLISVPDSRIDSWFRERGIAPQYVYNWQDITGAASTFKAWPATVKFLLYVAGTWVRGGGEILTLDTLYDSTLLGTNDYTALWSEESWLVLKRGHDSRVVTVPLSPTGATNIGVDIEADGTAAPVLP